MLTNVYTRISKREVRRDPQGFAALFAGRENEGAVTVDLLIVEGNPPDYLIGEGRGMSAHVAAAWDRLDAAAMGLARRGAP